MPSASMKVDPSGGWRHPQGGCNITHGSVGVVVEDDRRTLFVRELTEQPYELGRALLARIGDVGQSVVRVPPSFELSCGDSKGDPPNPREWIRQGVAPTQGLGERLSCRVVSHLGISGVGDKRPPKSSPLLPVEALDRARGTDVRCLHSPPISGDR